MQERLTASWAAGQAVACAKMAFTSALSPSKTCATAAMAQPMPSSPKVCAAALAAKAGVGEVGVFSFCTHSPL